MRARPMSSRTLSNGTSSVSAATWANTVWAPVAMPAAATRTSPGKDCAVAGAISSAMGTKFRYPQAVFDDQLAVDLRRRVDPFHRFHLESSGRSGRHAVDHPAVRGANPRIARPTSKASGSRCGRHHAVHQLTAADAHRRSGLLASQHDRTSHRRSKEPGARASAVGEHHGQLGVLVLATMALRHACTFATTLGQVFRYANRIEVDGGSGRIVDRGP